MIDKHGFGDADRTGSQLMNRSTSFFRDTQWTVEQLSFVAGHKSVSTSVWHDLLSKFGISKEDRVKVIKNLGRTLLDELENLFRSYWDHHLGVSDGLLQVLGHNVRVKTQEVQSYQLQAPEHA